MSVFCLVHDIFGRQPFGVVLRLGPDYLKSRGAVYLGKWPLTPERLTMGA